jgi:endo-1,4-beta-mannosidase
MRSATLFALVLAGCSGAMPDENTTPDSPVGTTGGTSPGGGSDGNTPGQPGQPGDNQPGSPDGGTPSTPPPSGFVAAQGGQLVLDGKPFRLVGANRYDVASFPPGSGKFACGNAYSDAQVDQLVGELASSTGATVLRLWAFQSFTLGGSDWSMLDRALATAKKHGLKVIFTFENEWQDCTQKDPTSSDGRKSGAWYRDGYQKPLGSYPQSYRDYVGQVVTRYAADPTVALWQLMNEAESDDAAALQAFVADMGQVVKAIDARHLLSLGTIGGGQAGTDNAHFAALHGVAQIDVVESHDYGAEMVALPGAPDSQQNSVYADMQVAKKLGKPFFLGEVGIAAPSPMYPFTAADRARYMDAKLQASFAAGSSGFLVWSFYDLKTDNHEGWDFNGTDPLAAVLKKYVQP